MSRQEERERMVRLHLASRGITDPAVLEAFRSVPREWFLPSRLEEFAYDDAPLPIGEGQTISQPYIVAVTIQAMGLSGGERVLEIGTGSGYAAAVLSRIASEVYTVERLPGLAKQAASRLEQHGYENVEVVCRDGTTGWPEHAPYDAIAVAAGGPEVPQALLRQLAPGGKLVIPVGASLETQVLTRIVREGADEFHRESLASVRFVPLIGEEGWRPPSSGTQPMRRSGAHRTVTLVREEAEVIEDFGDGIETLVDRVGGARLVLLGEASHGTSEFYAMRARISRELIERHGFDFVAVEADWPDAARVDTYVLGDPPRSDPEFTAFARFPTWMWRNREVEAFVDWLRSHNLERAHREDRAGFHGLDLYSLYTSIASVLAYLDDVDPDAAAVARARYGLLTPWQKDPASYGRAVLSGRYESVESEVVATLVDMLERRLEYARRDGERFFDAAQNARVVANAEKYYRAMYYASRESWNLRDKHMFDTLTSLLAFYGPESRGIVWEHNSHVGNAAATEMGARGEFNVGQLCREAFGDGVYSVGFGTDHGTVAAASDWGGPMQVMSVRPALDGSYERLFHETGIPAFRMALRTPRRVELREELMVPMLERAIGVIYRPETERASHYFQAVLPEQFDEYVWFDSTSAVTPLMESSGTAEETPDTYPWGV